MSSARQKSEAQKGGRSKTSPLPDPANATRGVAEANALDAELLQSMMDSLKADIFGKIDSLSSSLRSEITSVRKELKESIGPLQAKVEQHGQTVLELERAATDHSGRITELEATVSRLTAQAKHADDRCEDLEGRSRMNNIRLVGISEGLEGPRSTEFIAKLLQEILRLDEKPLLDRAHRTLRDRPREGDAPRPFVVRVHYFHIRNEILRRAGELSPLLCQGKRISIFADYTSTVAKKRAAFGTVKRQLHSCPGIKFGLLYPAVLRITLPSGDTHRFEDPTAANDFVNTKLKKAVTPSAV
ncbi:hypothetical protein KUCAC02_015915 [Chaenocephalus aceratus]|uniref:Uncharacterized protein n=1 Tax=Chaenocephalus aceratus TaxID=36190 RepID=A0ACB9Y1E5_CHAAC|nr:hypothetical protein KUCAC02_015915 [Chaenocephalus aceratus]